MACPGWSEYKPPAIAQPIRPRIASITSNNVHRLHNGQRLSISCTFTYFLHSINDIPHLHVNMPPTLGYWKIRGLAQPARLMLNYVGQEFEDKQYEQGDGPGFSKDAWFKVKPTLGLDFPNLPYFIDGDIKVTQSNAVLRYIARKHDLLGKTDKEKVYVDMMLDNAMDLRNGVVRMVYNADYENLLKEYQSSGRVKELLDGYEKWLSNKKWFAGDNLTVADFPMYELMDQHRLMMPGCLDKYPKLTAFVAAFEALPKIKEFMATPKFLKRPVNNKMAKFM